MLACRQMETFPYNCIRIALRRGRQYIRSRFFLIIVSAVSVFSRFSCCCLMLVLLASPLAHAQVSWRDLPPEERRQLRQQMREQWQERDHHRDMDAPPPRRWQEVPPEDRRQMRQQMREEIREHHPRRPDYDRPPPGGGRGNWRHER